MNFFKYIGVTKDEFVEKYLHEGLVQEAIHPTLPLNIFCYGRRAVHENVWDNVTSRCRGIVVDRETEEIVARPFEKFHNFGSSCVEGTTPESNSIFTKQPVIWEKMDGFMVTGFYYRGEWHAASKCSFTSIHAKWATIELRKKMANATSTNEKTLVFEGLHPDLRIVINYGTPAELVLLAVIDNETGDEFTPEALRHVAEFWDFNVPDQIVGTWETTRDITSDSNNKYDEEGYVLTWYRAGTTPFRLKMKYIDYLRLHRMVTGVSPKRIWEVLAMNQTEELKDYLDNSTPWFSAFVKKWSNYFNAEAARIEQIANEVYLAAREKVGERHGAFALEDFAGVRKTFAEVVTKFPEVSAICFGMLDKKDIRKLIWGQVRKVATGSPMVDAHSI